MADFVYVDKENESSQVRLLSRPQQTTARGIVGKSFQTLQSHPATRKVLGDVNRESSARCKSADIKEGNQTQMVCKKPWRMWQPAVPASKPPKMKEKSVCSQDSKDQKLLVTTVDSGSNVLYEEIEKMHVPPEEPDTYSDIWAIDYPIIPNVLDENSSDEDSLLSQSDDELVSVTDYDLEEPVSGEIELTLEMLPSIEDIPLPPLEDLLPSNIDIYSSLN